VAIGVDFLLITLLIGMGTRPGAYLLDWLVVAAVSILIHELGHAFAVHSCGIDPSIRHPANVECAVPLRLLDSIAIGRPTCHKSCAALRASHRFVIAGAAHD
jgi:hypothetical protein